MAKIIIREIPKTAKIEILGHTFDGLTGIRRAVELYSRVDRDLSWQTTPRQPIAGLHVIAIYEPYPCFDSDDYAGEDRDYCNFFFSIKAFSKTDIERLRQLPHRFNAQIVNHSMPQWAAPAVYYGGCGDNIVVAIKEG